MQRSSSFKWLIVLVVYLAVAGCSEESGQGEPINTSDTNGSADTLAGDSGTQDGADAGGDSATLCGNGVIDDGEECDDGDANSDALADACRTNCTEASCGDGVIDLRLNETCDDGNAVDDDGCNNLCRLSSCGDGVLQAGEECDNGPSNSDIQPNACRANCTDARCGDSVTDAGEGCDDGNDFNDDACIGCVVALCGDGIIRQNVETCDDENAAALDGCSDQCQIELGFICQGQPSACNDVCGDGIKSSQEACDDANTADNDYCSADCAQVTGRCGDGVVQGNEGCDDGNVLPNDGCAPNCTFSGSCGDTIIQPTETCDDGNTDNGDYCASDCSQVTGRCGDGIPQSNEQCDDGNLIVGDYCNNGCIVTGFCGDGVIQTPAGEACDDGNTVSSDGCVGSCAAFELGWNCTTTSPTNCAPVLCSANQYVQNNACVACPAGTTNAAGDAASGPNTSCDPTLCAVDQRVQNNACIDCSAGTINAEGDDASGPDTTCAPLLCSANQYVLSNTCAACPPGTTNAAGDDASGADTSCDTIFCLADELVLNNACVACPPGTTNAAGDDATGQNTTCDATLCAVDQYVQNHACVDCSFAMINEAGDDASGADTTCDNDPCYFAFGVFCADFEQAYVKASNTGADDTFGWSVALDGDTLVVGAYHESSSATGINGNQANESEPWSGAVYVFTRSGTTWTQQAYIKASNTDAGDDFGNSVALYGDTLAVGAWNEDSFATGINGDQADNFGIGSGAVYVFTRAGTTWSQQAYIKASNTGANDGFGYSVALSGDTLAVGAYEENSIATGINGNQADNSASNSGAVYVFTRSGTTWNQQAYIKASNTGANDGFGNSVALDADTLVVGAIQEDSSATGINGNQADNSASNSGAVYVFTRAGTTWTQQAYIKASNAESGDAFGGSVALSGDTLAVSAGLEDSNATGLNGDQTNDSALDSGAVYVFTRAGTTWTQQAYIKASNSSAFDIFASVVLSGDTLAVGAFYEDSFATGINGDQTNNASTNSGAVYVFTRTGTTWTQAAYIKASNTGADDWFGYSVALSGDTLAVGAPNENSNAIGINGDQTNNSISNSGAVYIRKIAP